MHAFHYAFTRKAKMNNHSVTRHKMHWRNKENGWEVVSSALCDKWDNAVHPAEHDDFNIRSLGGETEEEGFSRYTPEETSNWETFHSEESHMPVIFDQEAHNQFESAFRNDIDYLNAEAVAEFLHGTFDAEYTFSEEYKECTACDGTGKVYDGVSDSLTYCYSDCGNTSKHEKLRVSDDACSCTSCNEPENLIECENCDGNGDIHREGFTRRFPYSRDKILSEMPSRRELQVVQFTLNKMAKIAEENNGTPSFRKVMKLFDTLENGDSEEVIETAISFIEPTFRTIETPARDETGSIETDERGKPVMEEKPDPEAIQETKVKLTATLNDMPKQQAEAMCA